MAAKTWAELRIERAVERELETRATSLRVDSFGRGSAAYSSMSQAFALPQAAQEGFRANPTIYRCVMAIASAASALNLGVRETGVDEATVDYDFSDPIALLFNKRPNPHVSALVLKLVAWMQLELTGQSFVYMDRGPTADETPTLMANIYDPVEVLVDNRTDPLSPALLGFRVRSWMNSGASTGQGVVNLLPAEVLWLRYPDPADPWGAMSPLRAASWAADLDAYARQWQVNEFRNQAAPPGVIYLGDLTQEQFNQVRGDFEARMTAPRNARRHLFLSGPTKPDYTRMGLSPLEMSYIQSRGVNATDIMVAYGCSKDLLEGAATYENRKEAKAHLWSETIFPKLQIVESEIDRQLFPDDTRRAEFDVRKVDALKDNADSITKRTSQDFRSGYVLIDEARQNIGLAPLPNGEGQKLFVPRGAAAGDAEVGAVDTTGSDLAGAAGTLSKKIELETRASKPEPDARALTKAEIQRHYQRYIAVGTRAVKRLAEKQKRVVLSQLSGSRRRRAALETRSVDDTFDSDYWEGVTSDSLSDFLTQVYEAGSMRTAAGLGLSFDTLSPKVIDAMDSRLAFLSKKVTETTRSALEAALVQQGTQEGEGAESLSDRIAAVFDELAGYRADTIAATEVVSGFNAASRETAVDSGVVRAKRWLTAGDSAVRDDHAELDGEEVALEEPYSNGLMFPGDPSGDAGEVINCRCVEEYVLIDSSGNEVDDNSADSAE